MQFPLHFNSDFSIRLHNEHQASEKMLRGNRIWRGEVVQNFAFCRSTFTWVILAHYVAWHGCTQMHWIENFILKKINK